MKQSCTYFSRPKYNFFTLFILFFLLTGCTNSQGVLPNYQDDDLRERHLLKQKVILQKLTIIPIGPKRDQISPFDASRINGFVENYKLTGLDYLTINYSGSYGSEQIVATILKKYGELENIKKLQYPKLDSDQISLSFSSTQFVYEGNCDGKSTNGGITYMVPNKSMGCAFVSALSQQVDQPYDIIEPRERDKKYFKNSSVNTTSTNISNTPNNSNTSNTVNSVDLLKSFIN